ncbi:MAG: DUF805 domain-containing protein [Chloroflexota bacterium]|nr:DUF805 domain-containing protein [Chloroflexota bacterium]
MDAIEFFFSFKGRISRWEFWKGHLMLVAVGIALALFGAAAGPSQESMDAVFGIYTVVGLIAQLALSTKRLHDRGRSGWFVLVGLIPFGGIWLAVELFLLGSDERQEEYAPGREDPLEGWWEIIGGHGPFEEKSLRLVRETERRYQLLMPGERRFVESTYVELRPVGDRHWVGEMIQGEPNTDENAVVESARGPVDIRILGDGDEMRFYYEHGQFVAGFVGSRGNKPENGERRE